LDTCGQYCHLIARKIRELGVSSEVFASEAHHKRTIFVMHNGNCVFILFGQFLESSFHAFLVGYRWRDLKVRENFGHGHLTNLVQNSARVQGWREIA